MSWQLEPIDGALNRARRDIVGLRVALIIYLAQAAEQRPDKPGNELFVIETFTNLMLLNTLEF